MDEFNSKIPGYRTEVFELERTRDRYEATRDRLQNELRRLEQLKAVTGAAPGKGGALAAIPTLIKIENEISRLESELRSAKSFLRVFESRLADARRELRQLELLRGQSQREAEARRCFDRP